MKEEETSKFQICKMSRYRVRNRLRWRLATKLISGDLKLLWLKNYSSDGFATFGIQNVRNSDRNHLGKKKWNILVKEAIFWSNHVLQWPTNPPRGRKAKENMGKLAKLMTFQLGNVRYYQYILVKHAGR